MSFNDMYTTYVIRRVNILPKNKEVHVRVCACVCMHVCLVQAVSPCFPPHPCCHICSGEERASAVFRQASRPVCCAGSPGPQCRHLPSPAACLLPRAPRRMLSGTLNSLSTFPEPFCEVQLQAIASSAEMWGLNSVQMGFMLLIRKTGVPIRWSKPAKVPLGSATAPDSQPPGDICALVCSV